MENKRKLSIWQIFFLIAIGIIGLLAVLFGIACIMFDHLMEGAAIILFDIVLITLLVVMIRDDKFKSEVKVSNLGAKVFTMRDVTVAFDGALGKHADVTLMSDGVYIEVIGEDPVGYRFDEMSIFSSDKPSEFAFAVNMEQSIVLLRAKRIHIAALVEAFRKHGVRGVCTNAR